MEEEQARLELLKRTYNWCLEQADKEKKRLEKQGASPIDMKVLDMSVLVQGKNT